MTSHKINQIDLLKYSPGGKYEIHTDHFTNCPRHLSVIMNLNDDYEGGDLIFTDQKEKEIKRLKLNKGSIVFFLVILCILIVFNPLRKEQGIVLLHGCSKI